MALQLKDAQALIPVLQKENRAIVAAANGKFIEGLAWGIGSGLVVGVVTGYAIFHK